MRGFLLTVAMATGIGLAWAATETKEYPIVGYTAPYEVFVASHQYTNVTTTRVGDQHAVLIDVPSTNNSIMHGHVGNCTSTSVATHTVRGPIEIAPSSNGGYVGVGEGNCLWLVTRYTVSGESVTIQGVTQTR